MAYEMKPNSGSLWKNVKKEADHHADYTGTVLIDGVEYWQSAWINSTSSGVKYFGQKFTRKEAKPENSYQKPAAVVMDDDIPF
jgi:triacylglycerol esterase/lipase EstA (alpha/beta hydrolase family)